MCIRDRSAIAPDWATGKDYLANQLVVNLSTLYRCLSDHTSTDFASNKSYWEELSGGESGGNGGGDIEKVLWEGTAGSTDATVVNSLINLSESVGNYDLLTIEFIAYSSANSAVRRPQRREFSVEQLKNLINTPSSINYGLQSVWAVSYTHLLNKELPNGMNQYYCNNVIFDHKCRLNKEHYAVQIFIDKVDGLSLIHIFTARSWKFFEKVPDDILDNVVDILSDVIGQ